MDMIHVACYESRSQSQSDGKVEWRRADRLSKLDKASQKSIESATAGIIHRVELASHGAHKPGGARCVSARPLGSERAHAGLVGIGEVGVNFS